MSTLALTPRFMDVLRFRYRAWRHERERRLVTLYRVMRADRTEVIYADGGDETLLGRYVGELLRGGAECLVIDKIQMSLAEADAIPAERLVG